MDELNAIYWHDGLLDDIRFSVGEDSGDIELNVRVYKDPQAPERYNLRVRFSGVTAYQATCDVPELLDYRRAGNISNAYCKTGRKKKKAGGLTFYLYLADGYIQISFQEVKMTAWKD